MEAIPKQWEVGILGQGGWGLGCGRGNGRGQLRSQQQGGLLK